MPRCEGLECISRQGNEEEQLCVVTARAHSCLADRYRSAPQLHMVLSLLILYLQRWTSQVHTF